MAASKKLQGITIEIGGNTTKLNQELSKSNKEARSLTTEIKSVEKALEMNPGNVDLITKKQKLLKEQIENTKDTLNTLKTAQKQFVDGGGDLNSEAYKEIDRQIKQTEADLKKLIASQSGLSANMESLASKTGAFGTKATALGNSFKPLSVAIAGITAASAVAWNEIDKAMDTVATKTGATGSNLAELQGIFEDVYGSFPTTAEEASNAVGEINTRLGFTGTELEKASVQFLKFATVNGTDVNTAVQLVTRAMGDAGIEANDYSDLLDMLTTASAASGISIDKLTENITKYGAPMRQLGYDTKESIALFSQWEKAGVNTEIAFSGMKKAISNFAKEGKDAKVEMASMMENIKSCGSLSEATTMAIDTFGAKAGPDLADAIYYGRFSLEEMMSVLENSSDSLNNTFEEVMDPADKAKVALNNLKLIGYDWFQTIQEALIPAIEAITKKLSDFREWFEKLSPSIKNVIITLGAILLALAPVLFMVGKLSTGISKAILTFGKLKLFLFGTSESAGALTKAMGLLASPIGIIIAVAAALAAGIAWLYNNNEDFRNSCNELISKVMPILQNAWQSFCNIIDQQIIPALQGVWTWFQENILPILAQLATAIVETLIPILDKMWLVFQEKILPVLQTLWNMFVENVLPIISQFVAMIMENVVPILEKLVEMFITYVLPALSAVASFILEHVVPAILQLWSWFAEFLLPIIQNVASFLIDVLSGAFDLVMVAVDGLSTAIDIVIGFFEDVWKWLEDVGVIDAFADAWQGLCDVIDAIVDGLKWIGENASNIFDGIGDVAGGIWGGIQDFGGWLNPFDSGGFGELSRNGSIALTTNINVTNNGTPISASTIRQWGNTITDIVDENLGRRGR